MALKRTYGRMFWNDCWVIDRMEPHVCLRLKAVFPRIPRTGTVPFKLIGGPQIDADLDWFMQRYPLELSEADRARLTLGRVTYEEAQASLEYMFSTDWKPSGLWKFRDGKAPYPYQAQAAELARATGRLLLLDDVGLGKSVSAIAAIANPDYLPACIIVQPHLADQWAEYIHDYTHMIPHVIKGTKPYQLPQADVFIFKFSNIGGWTDYVRNQPFKSVTIDELQELRNGTSTVKGQAADVFLANTSLRLGLTATPVYNYGSEMWHVMQFLEPDCLGSFDDFKIEWCTMKGQHWIVKDPDALGTFLREQRLSLRRTEHDVGWQMPPINTLMHQVPLDEDVIAASENLARSLAMKVMNGSFTERGQAARELDAFARHQTGVAKARYVAAFVRVLLEAGEPVLLAGWHRDCFAAGTPVLMRDGKTKSVEKVKVGDRVMGPDGEAREVRSLVAGHGGMYRITPHRGEPWVCSENHILVMKSSDRGGEIVKMTAKQYAALTPRRQRSLVLFRSAEIDFGGEPVLEPWLVGYWLGDGAATLSDLRVMSNDQEIRIEVEAVAARHGLSVTSFASPGTTGTSLCQHLVLSSGMTGPKNRNALLNHFRSLGLSDSKHVPLAYKRAPAEDRRQMLAGLIDSDGYVYGVNSAGSMEFTNKSERLARDVAFLARSLGLSATISAEDKQTPFNAQMERYYRVLICGNIQSIPMRIARKRPPKRNQIKNVLHTGFSIEKIDDDRYFGFEVDRDHLFLLGDFTVVHNCYDIWLKELADFKPVLYTGSETAAQKNRAKQAFIEGKTNLFIISIRSGAGLDGLQHRCHTAIVGELDWSPQVIKQFFGRLRRPGQTKQVDAIILHADGGSDPVMIEVNGLKASQSHGIVDPGTTPQPQISDETRIRQLAQHYIKTRAAGGATPVPVLPTTAAEIVTPRPAAPAPATPKQFELFNGAL